MTIFILHDKNVCLKARQKFFYYLKISYFETKKIVALFDAMNQVIMKLCRVL